METEIFDKIENKKDQHIKAGTSRLNVWCIQTPGR
jgi:hypothetical protein